MSDNLNDHDRGSREGVDETSVPAFNVPRLLIVLLSLMLAVHPLRDFILSDRQNDWVIFTFSFIPLRYVSDLSEQNFEYLWSPVTYSFLHGSYEHLMFNGLWMLAFGAPVLRRIGDVRFLLLFALSSAASAFGYGLLHDWTMAVLIGASGVVSALMGAACRFAISARSDRLPMALAHYNRRMSIIESLQDRTVLIFVILWLAGNLLIAFGVPIVGYDAGNIAWEAHIFGFLFGFLLFNFFDRQWLVRADL